MSEILSGTENGIYILCNFCGVTEAKNRTGYVKKGGSGAKENKHRGKGGKLSKAQYFDNAPYHFERDDLKPLWY